MRWIHDVFGNCVAVLNFSTVAKELKFETRIHLEHTPQNTPDFQIDTAVLKYPFSYDEDETADLARTMERHYPDDNDEVGKWARQFVGSRKHRYRQSAHDALLRHSGKLRLFQTNRTGHSAPADDVASTARNMPRLCAVYDGSGPLAWLCRTVRHWIHLRSKSRWHAKLGGGATHAWCQIYLPGAGWVEFDPTNGIVGNRDLIRVAVARDPRQAIPLYGTYAGKASDALGMTVQVNVTTVQTRGSVEPLRWNRVAGLS